MARTSEQIRREIRAIAADIARETMPVRLRQLVDQKVYLQGELKLVQTAERLGMTAEG